jgi:hypothetical protein
MSRVSCGVMICYCVNLVSFISRCLYFNVIVLFMVPSVVFWIQGHKFF